MNDFNQNPFNVIQQKADTANVAKTFVANVFSWMFLALTATAVTAYFFAATPSLLALLIGETGLSPLGWIVMLAPIGFVLLMSLGFNRLSAGALTILFIVYSIIMGMSLSFILLVYTQASIATTFAITAGMFGIMAVAGYTTKVDLSRFGSIMMMGLVGIIIASLVNMFIGSSQMDYIISFIGVLVFTGLTAWDVQKIKRIGESAEMGSDSARKLTIMGALTLYLDFINLFLFLLRFLGNRK